MRARGLDVQPVPRQADDGCQVRVDRTSPSATSAAVVSGRRRRSGSVDCDVELQRQRSGSPVPTVLSAAVASDRRRSVRSLDFDVAESLGSALSTTPRCRKREARTVSFGSLDDASKFDSKDDEASTAASSTPSVARGSLKKVQLPKGENKSNGALSAASSALSTPCRPPGGQDRSLADHSPLTIGSRREGRRTKPECDPLDVPPFPFPDCRGKDGPHTAPSARLRDPPSEAVPPWAQLPISARGQEGGQRLPSAGSLAKPRMLDDSPGSSTAAGSAGSAGSAVSSRSGTGASPACFRSPAPRPHYHTVELHDDLPDTSPPSYRGASPTCFPASSSPHSAAPRRRFDSTHTADIAPRRRFDSTDTVELNVSPDTLHGCRGEPSLTLLEQSGHSFRLADSQQPTKLQDCTPSFKRLPEPFHVEADRPMPHFKKDASSPASVSTAGTSRTSQDSRSSDSGSIRFYSAEQAFQGQPFRLGEAPSGEVFVTGSSPAAKPTSEGPTKSKWKVRKRRSPSLSEALEKAGPLPREVAPPPPKYLPGEDVLASAAAFAATLFGGVFSPKKAAPRRAQSEAPVSRKAAQPAPDAATSISGPPALELARTRKAAAPATLPKSSPTCTEDPEVEVDHASEPPATRKVVKKVAAAIRERTPDQAQADDLASDVATTSQRPVKKVAAATRERFPDEPQADDLVSDVATTSQRPVVRTVVKKVATRPKSVEQQPAPDLHGDPIASTATSQGTDVRRVMKRTVARTLASDVEPSGGSAVPLAPEQDEEEAVGAAVAETPAKRRVVKKTVVRPRSASAAPAPRREAAPATAEAVTEPASVGVSAPAASRVVKKAVARPKVAEPPDLDQGCRKANGRRRCRLKDFIFKS
mmetsp:Transcript_113885/g.362071  ORF Transcript_113885/g.362071 Transcript_113885/m.362071 type:complete len:872 (+) Transcript_113885:99-2714(+)